MSLLGSNYVFSFYFTGITSNTNKKGEIQNPLFQKAHLYDDHVCSLSPKGRYKLCAVIWKLSMSDQTNVSIIEDPNGILNKKCEFVTVDYQHKNDAFPVMSLECMVKSEIMAGVAQSDIKQFLDIISAQRPKSQEEVHFFYISAGFTKGNLKSVFMHIKAGKYVCSNLYVQYMDFNYYGIK